MRRWLPVKAGTTRSARAPAGRLAAGLALAVVVTLVPATGPAAGTEPGAAGERPSTPATTTTDEAQTVTLVTGDRVRLEPATGGRMAATVDPAPRNGQSPTFETVQDGDEVYVYPSDAAPLIPDVLDRELFNVTRLAEYGYAGDVPVITTYHDRVSVRSRVSGTGVGTVTGVLPSINATTSTVDPDGAWWRTMSQASAAGGAGVEKVWLDGLATVALDESGPLVGAPEAAAAGYDGTGQTVAVLDTGIDEEHPELAGRVVDAVDFTGEGTTDAHGHGTHVASTVAGTGDRYTGIAPGADLLSGKVCDSNGSCPHSAIIAGMEWAAPRADIVSMSIGTQSPSDGTDPTSQAVNSLTTAHDTLFVVASGNIGSSGVASPGAADRALTVGAVDKQEELAGFSGRGPRMGDFAVKPDVTAPGVDIVAARSGDGTMPPPAEPVSDLHIRASGTSMATPHVAGAAAVLRQQDPELSAAELKAALTGTAVPHPDLGVYEQGGGRIDIPAALDAPVRAVPASLSLGNYTFPHDDREPVTTELTYTNRTDTSVTLDLTAEAANRADDPAGGMLSVTPATVSIDAGGSVTVDVTLDVRPGPTGTFGGYLVANRDGEPVSRTPLGFRKEAESYTLTVEGLDRKGNAARRGSSVDVINMEDATIHEIDVEFTDGTATVRMPPGRYVVLGMIYLYHGQSNFGKAKAFVGEAGIEVFEDTTVRLDAREADPVQIDTPAHPGAAPIGTMRFAYRFAGEETGSYVHTWTSQAQPHYAMAIPQVDTGEFEFYHRWRIGEPRLALSVSDPVTQELSPRMMAGSTPRVDGDFALPLVDAGFGAPEDYDGLDADGAIVLARRGGPNYASKEAAARAAGAVALVVANDREGNFVGWVGNDAEIPTMSISKQEGDDLQSLLDDGDVTLRLFGEPATPYLYDVVFRELGAIPDDVTYEVTPDELAAVENTFHGGVPGHEMGEGRHLWAAWESISISLIEDVFAGQERTEYFTPGDMMYQQYAVAAQPFEGKVEQQVTTYPEPDTWQRSWFESPAAPAAIGGVQEGRFGIGEPTYREGDQLAVRIQEWSDAQGNYGVRDSSIDTTAFRLYRGEELIGESEQPDADFALDPGPADYRLELDVTRDASWWTTSTKTRTAWTVGSRRPDEGERDVLPLLHVSYDMPLDGHNRRLDPQDRRGPPHLQLDVGHQPGADGPMITGVRAWVSYDDGDHWRQRAVRPGPDGGHQVILPARPAPDGAEFASLRVEAWDAGGNRIEQEITRAWQVGR